MSIYLSKNFVELHGCYLTDSDFVLIAAAVALQAYSVVAAAAVVEIAGV